jgi:hypothetical protein
LNCPRCGKEIDVDIPKNKWAKAISNKVLEAQKIPNSTADAELIFLVNYDYRENTWLCKECFKIWDRIFQTQSCSRWREFWNIFVKNLDREIVQFT